MSTYSPDFILHRNEQVEQIANILGPSLRLEKPSNLFIYGKTGVGKTLSVKYIVKQMSEVSKKENIPLKLFYINCKLRKVADTEYRLIAQLVREFGKEIPPTGLPTDEVYKIFFNTVDNEKQLLILILDEIDQLVKKVGDELLYNLTRINTELNKSQISIIGISNDLVFVDNLDPRIKSSLSEEEILFPPYNAMQIQDILNQRAKEAFKEGAIETGVIEKCAAYAAREHGDARRALELLRVAGELAERNGYTKVKIKHIDDAEDKIERDRIMDIITTQPKQFQAVLYAILSLYTKKNNIIFTGKAYEVYKGTCFRAGLRPLTQRRVSDIIAELDMLGIINAKVISKGRYGRTREISLAVTSASESKIKKILEEGLGLT
jgi:cell division control protein 6